MFLVRFQNCIHNHQLHATEIKNHHMKNEFKSVNECILVPKDCILNLSTQEIKYPRKIGKQKKIKESSLKLVNFVFFVC